MFSCMYELFLLFLVASTFYSFFLYHFSHAHLSSQVQRRLSVTYPSGRAACRMGFSVSPAAPGKSLLIMSPRQRDAVQREDTTYFACRPLEEEKEALVVAPAAHTWFLGSPNPKRSEFVFPSNRSSASTAPPNRSTSPSETRPQVLEGGGNLDAMRREMIRLYDCNAELREQVKSLQAALHSGKHAQIAEYGLERCARCAGLGAALKAEQMRCREMDQVIISLREELAEAKRVAVHVDNPSTGEKGKLVGTLRERLAREGRQPPVATVNQSVAHLVLQDEIAMLKARFTQPLRDTSCTWEPWLVTQNASASLSASTGTGPTRPQTPDSRQSVKERITATGTTNSPHLGASALPVFQNSSTLSGSHGGNEGLLSSLHWMPHTSQSSVIASHTKPTSASSHVFAPQTLADLSPLAATTIPRDANESWYDDDEVREVVSSSQASRMRLAASPRRLLQLKATLGQKR